MKATASGSYVRIEGLDDLITWAKTANPEMQKALRKALKEATKPVLTNARANASAIADDSTMRSSLSLSVRANGTKYLLRSTDPAAGVKEFARAGAVYHPRSTDKRANARKMAVFPVGVPRRANPPRVMVKAVEDAQEEVIEAVNAALEGVLEKAGE